MVFATDTVTVALPDEAVRTHASVVVLFLVADLQGYSPNCVPPHI